MRQTHEKVKSAVNKMKGLIHKVWSGQTCPRTQLSKESKIFDGQGEPFPRRGIPRAELPKVEQLCMFEESKKVAVRVGAGGQQGTDIQGPWPLSMVLTLSLEETLPQMSLPHKTVGKLPTLDQPASHYDWHVANSNKLL